MKCDIPGIFLRLIMDLCTRQTIKTAWNGVLFSKFYGSVNGLCVRFNGVLYNPGVTTKLFCAHCCSFYGSQEYASIYEIIWSIDFFDSLMSSNNVIVQFLASFQAHVVFNNTPISQYRKFVNNRNSARIDENERGKGLLYALFCTFVWTIGRSLSFKEITLMCWSTFYVLNNFIAAQIVVNWCIADFWLHYSVQN